MSEKPKPLTDKELTHWLAHVTNPECPEWGQYYIGGIHARRIAATIKADREQIAELEARLTAHKSQLGEQNTQIGAQYLELRKLKKKIGELSDTEGRQSGGLVRLTDENARLWEVLEAARAVRDNETDATWRGLCDALLHFDAVALRESDLSDEALAKSEAKPAEDICPKCKGSGKLIERAHGISETVMGEPYTCYECNGTGWVNKARPEEVSDE